jgi:1,4-alpha-glucan branching enzyme
MQGSLCLVLHAHLPFVRHPEHDRFLEEKWLFEAVTETYLPLLELFDRWMAADVPARLTLTLSPTLCSMLLDPLLQSRCARYLDDAIELADRETYRTLWEKPLHAIALFYAERLRALRRVYDGCQGDLVRAFRRHMDRGCLEIIASAATHAVLPLLSPNPPSVRAQLLVARDHYRSCFGRDPRGFWLPECAYVEGLEKVLAEAGIRWFILESHGLLHARPRPRHGVFAPIITPAGVAAFGRDLDSARQVWSRQEGYPGDPRYRDFYRDAGFDLDYEYLRPWMVAPGHRSFTGMKYHRITGGSGPKEPYVRAAALEAVHAHARHFFEARLAQFRRLESVLDCPPVVVCPYDAELFGHWWFEGPEFLDALVRMACAGQKAFALSTPEEYLRRYPSAQLAIPAASSWGERGHLGVWLNEKNEWIYPQLDRAQRRMTSLARRFRRPSPLETRALRQTARELLLAQASDWPFILSAGTSPDYARRRIEAHLSAVSGLDDQLVRSRVDADDLARLEAQNNLFPGIDFRHWA